MGCLFPIIGIALMVLAWLPLVSIGLTLTVVLAALSIIFGRMR